MISLKRWQWVVLALPPIAIAVALISIALVQLHTWGLSWIWAIVAVVLVGWRWLLGRWTRPVVASLEAAIADLDLPETSSAPKTFPQTAPPPAAEAERQALALLAQVIEEARQDGPLWENWDQFWGRCTTLVAGVARSYHPEVPDPLLEIYVPQAYGLLRGTVDDLDRWMAQLSPVLGRVTVGQAYRAYGVYQRLEPTARKLLRLWGWGQWLLNPAAAAARFLSQPLGDRANQQLLANLNQLLREAALQNLCRRAIALYGGSTLPAETFQVAPPVPAQSQTATVRSLLERAEPPEPIAQRPVNLLLIGRTGAGKSSLINGLFDENLAETDVLPSTAAVRPYRWRAPTGETLNLWDTPGYEQVDQGEFRDRVLAAAIAADLTILVTPATDPALAMDGELLDGVARLRREQGEADGRAIVVVTQVDRLRPVREWRPPYGWRTGDRPKEQHIREAVAYRQKVLGDRAAVVLPVVLPDGAGREGWGLDDLAAALMDHLEPTKQVRLARFFNRLDRRAIAAARIIDKYVFQMSTTQGLTAMLKSPVLHFLSIMTTGQASLAAVLAEQIPVEQLPVVIGKLQLAYELFDFLRGDRPSDLTAIAQEPSNTEASAETDAIDGISGEKSLTFDLKRLWPIVTTGGHPPDRDARALGYALLEYWLEGLSIEELHRRYRDRLQDA
ncbi:MAG: 50S ribosome-binding GTPase [Cyanobacteria bacterium]|nr:50S ribosome-binding GTPase [Cyanobacteriota bacterium]